MSESGCEAVGAAPQSQSRHGGGVLGLFKRGGGDSAAVAKENSSPQLFAAATTKPAVSRHGSGFLSPLTRRKAVAGASSATAAPSGLSAGGWASQTAPQQQLLQQQQQQHQADLSKTKRPEQRRALLEQKKRLIGFKAVLQAELAQVTAELEEVETHLEKLSLFDDLDLDGSAASSSCAPVRDTSSRGSRRSVKSMLTERSFSRKRLQEQQQQAPTLQDILAQQRRSIPLIVAAACDFLRADVNVSTEGLFRVSSNQQLMQSVLAQFLNGEIRDFSQSEHCRRDPHIVATILKLFFRQLGQPLIPQEAYLCMSKILGEASSDDVLRMRRALDTLVPRQERFVLHYLVKFLVEVAAHSAANMMTPSNLGIVIAPNIFKLPDDDITGTTVIANLVEFMIEHYQPLFADAPPAAKPRLSPGRVAAAAVASSSSSSAAAAGRRTSLLSGGGSPSPSRHVMPRTSPLTAAALLNSSGRSGGRPSLSPNAARVAAARAAAAAAEQQRMHALRRESGGCGSPMGGCSGAGCAAHSIASTSRGHRHAHGHGHGHSHKHTTRPSRMDDPSTPMH